MLSSGVNVFGGRMLNLKKVWNTNTEINVIAVIISIAVIIIPLIMLYFYIGDLFWKVILMIGCCLLTIPFAMAYGLGRSGAPATPNQLLSGVLKIGKEKEANVNEAAEEKKVVNENKKYITFTDVIKGLLFVIFMYLILVVTGLFVGFLIDTFSK
jgi:uncharacterized membrane protein SpoIIM required for sporulation